VIDALIPVVEEAQAEGAIVVLKWDGERADSRCTVVVTRRDTDYAWRKDGLDIGTMLAEAMSEYKAAHARGASHVER